MKKLSLILCAALLCALVACGGEDTDEKEKKTDSEITISPTEALTPTSAGLHNEGNLDNSENYSDIWGDDTATLTPSEDGGKEMTPTQGAEDGGNEVATPTPVNSNSGEKDEATPTPGITKDADKNPETTPGGVVVTVTPTQGTDTSKPTVSSTVSPKPTNQATATITPTTEGLDSDSGSAPLDNLDWGPLIPM